MSNEITFSPVNGERVWVKVFSNWSSGTYIGEDANGKHLVREDKEGGGNLYSSDKVLPWSAYPNDMKKPKQDDHIIEIRELKKSITELKSIIDSLSEDVQKIKRNTTPIVYGPGGRL